ncbi:MAG TPA: hypothetical protein VF108_02755 [Actinomycetota bacterium]
MLVNATILGWILLAIIACGGPTPAPPALPPDALPGMQSELSDVTVDVLARDALEPAGLASLLEEAGYVSGRERTYAGPGANFSLAVTRVLVFDSPTGAAAYLDWLRGHTSDLLGSAEPLDPLDLPGSPFLQVHLPGGCCPKAVPIYVSAWRRGSTVLFVKASGRGADVRAVEALATELDDVVGRASDA